MIQSDWRGWKRSIHPAVREAREAFIAENREAPALLFDIPLLFETASHREFDKIDRRFCARKESSESG